MPASTTIPPGTQLGPYEIIGLLGVGGMGEVYRARDARLDRQVAIKVLREPARADTRSLQRFEAEARAAGALGHPNVLVVFDVGRHGDVPYLVTELLDGVTLHQHLMQAGAVPPRKALGWAAQIARGLAAAHEKGIVHRDLKPGNLFLTQDGRIKILDFGLAKLMFPALGDATTGVAGGATESGAVLGTVGYMAPEQVRGQPIDYAADIFALGVVIHEMLSGTPPFRRDTVAETLTAILKEDPPALPASVPLAVGRLVQGCLEKRAEDRFHSAHDLSLALETLSDGSRSSVEVAVSAPASSISRRSVLAGAAGLGLLGVGVGAGAVLWRGTRTVALPSFRRLTFRRGMIRTARFAPDYQTVLYGALWDGDDCRTYTVRPESPESSPLNLPVATPLAVSSSGEIALSLGAQLRSVMPYGTLARVPLAGGAPRELLEDVKYADWSPDGSELAAVRMVEGREVLEYPLGNLIAEPSTPGGGFSFVRVSPDGLRVACFELTVAGGLVGSVAIVDRGGDKRVISPEYFNCFGLAWPDDEIWFTAADELPLFRDAIHAITPDGRSRVVARIPGNLSLHDVSPDGRLLLARTDDRSGIAVLPPGETRERDLSWLDSPFPGDISRDGRLIAFSEMGVGGGPQNAAYLRSSTGGPAVHIGDGNPRALSPDGRWVLAASTVAPPSPYLDLLPTGAGQGRRIDHPGFEYISARWVPDGSRLIVLGQEEDKAPELYWLDLEGDVLQPVSPNSGAVRSWALSPDGTRVAVTTDMAVELRPLEGGDPFTVPGLSPPERLLGWIDAGLLVSADPLLALETVYRIDPVSGRRELWRQIRPSDPTGIMSIERLVVTPDGRSYAYWWARALSDLYLVEGVR